MPDWLRDLVYCCCVGRAARRLTDVINILPRIEFYQPAVRTKSLLSSCYPFPASYLLRLAHPSSSIQSRVSSILHPASPPTPHALRFTSYVLRVTQPASSFPLLVSSIQRLPLISSLTLNPINKRLR